MTARISLGALPLLTALALLSPSQLEAQQYFGEDLNNNAHRPLTSYPNSQNAADEFLSRLSGVGTEDFESISPGRVPPLGLDFPGAGTATLSGNGSVRSVAPGTTNGAGRYATSGSNYFEISTGAPFSILFSQPVAAFGFFGIDISDFGEQLFLTFARDNGNNTEIEVPSTLGRGGSTDGSVLFFGFIDAENPFTSVQFRSSVGEFFAFDDMTIGSVAQVQPPNTTVPEPISMTLLGTGLAGVAAVRRRRRTAEEEV